MKYFVCFGYEDKGKIELGNTVIEVDDEYKDIQEMERKLEKMTGYHSIILDYKPLDGTAFRYTRCGDAEIMEVPGGGLTFKPHISIGIGSSEGIEKTAKEIAGAIKKLLISQMQE